MMQLPLQKAIEEAKKNPTSDFAKQLRQSIESGQLDDSARKQGVDLTKYGRAPVQQNSTVAEKVLDFTGGKEIAQGLGQSMAMKENAKLLEQTQKEQFGIQEQLIKRIQAKKNAGEDTSRLEGALADINDEIKKTGEGASDILNPNKLTNKEVIGDALQLATTAGGSKLGGSIVGEAKTATSFAQGAIQGAKSGAIGGAVVGSATGASQALQENKDISGVAKGALSGAVTGGVTGGVLGGLTGGTLGALKGAQLRKEVLNQQIASGEKTIDTTAKKFQRQKAKLQGYDDTDIDFMASMKSNDKAIAQKQIALAEKALKDKRVTERPIDIVGNNFVSKAKKLESLNKKIGAEVDSTAKTLKGKTVDVSQMRDNTIKKLQDANVSIRENGTLDFSQSVFKNTPQIQKELQKVIKSIPDGSDAYQLHIFKKTIDEMVDYGVSGEGLKGNAKTILKALRSYADDALDTTFPEYNKVNTDFKVTKEIIDSAKDLFGKKNGFSKEKGGQILRAVFSNRDSRGRVIELLKNMEDVGKKYKIGTKDNLVDQALFTEILEDVYGTQATTSLQGQVKRAVQGTGKVIKGLRNPIEGAGELVATSAEKILGISDEKKRKMLLELLK